MVHISINYCVIFNPHPLSCIEIRARNGERCPGMWPGELREGEKTSGQGFLQDSKPDCTVQILLQNGLRENIFDRKCEKTLSQQSLIF